MDMKRLLLGVVATLSLSGLAAAFGTEPADNNLGSEHAKITRAALPDLGPETLRRLAGEGDDPGAVGYPDEGGDLVDDPAAHCLGGDHMPGVEGYAQDAATARTALEACRQFIRTNIEEAVKLAGALDAPQPADVDLSCEPGGTEGSIKCKVLHHLGLAFHAAQDFYANSNWVDRPAEGGISVTNPPGLGQAGRAPWLDLRKDETVPEGLVSAGTAGIGGSLGRGLRMVSALVEVPRISIHDLGKSTGPIGRGLGGTGTTPRGAINGNFSRAVTAAVADTTDKWSFFRERVLATWGGQRGERILCALRSDSHDPDACAQVASVQRTCQERADADIAATASLDDAFVPENAATPEETAAATTRLANLRRLCVIEEADVTRAYVIRGRTADEGRAAATARATADLARWGTCPIQLQQRLPAMQETVRRELAQDPAARKDDGAREMALLARLFSNCVLEANLRQVSP